MRKHIILPALAIVGGAVGFFLRRWELVAAFEADTALAIPFAPASIALIAFSVAMAAAFLLLARSRHSVFPGGYDQAFGAEGNTACMVVMVLAAFLLLGSGLLSALELGQTVGAQYRAQDTLTRSLLPVLFPVLPQLVRTVLVLAACPCVLWVGRNNYRGRQRGKYAAALLIPAYAVCLWLITAYQQRAGDPIRRDYIYELFAILSALLALYFIAGFSFERAKVSRTVFFSALGVYFSLTTLADVHDLATNLLYGFVILYLAANLAVLLANDSRWRDAVPEPAPQTPRMPEADEAEEGETEELKTEEPSDG